MAYRRPGPKGSYYPLYEWQVRPFGPDRAICKHNSLPCENER